MKMVTAIGYARESGLASSQSKRRVILCMWQVQIKFTSKLFQPSLIWDFSLLILGIHEIQMNFKSNWVEIILEICIKWIEWGQISSVKSLWLNRCFKCYSSVIRSEEGQRLKMPPSWPFYCGNWTLVSLFELKMFVQCFYR